jgi:hypothetical protein
MDALGSLLPRELARRHLMAPVLAAQVVDAWKVVVKKIVPAVEKYTQALTYKQGFLTVMCFNSSVAAELQLRHDLLHAEYALLFPKKPITIRFRTGGQVDQGR